MELKLKKSSFDYGKDKLMLEDKFILFLYSFYFILKPFYFWSSGLPQISDFIMILLVAIFVLAKKGYSLKLSNKGILIFSSLFTFYTIGINLFWSIILSSTDMILPSVYLFYNYLVLFVVSLMVQLYQDKIIEITFKSCLISLSIQIIIYMISGGSSGVRNVGTFNNPNQLGYYALLITALIMFCANQVNTRVRWTVLGISSGLILAFTSLSKAAILSYLGLVFIFILKNLLNKKNIKKMIIVLVMLISSYSLINSTTNILNENQVLQSVETRLNSIGDDSDDNLEGRGYGRIIDFPEYWVFGAGEGEFNRFSGPLQGYEFHSTLGNIQVSYGLIGLILYILLLLSVIKGNGYSNFYIIIFILIYGITHNGIRNSLFWILVALIASRTDNRQNADKTIM